MSRKKTQPLKPTRQVLRGAKQIATYLYGNDEAYRTIYGMAAQLGLFHLANSNTLYGLPEVIDRKIAEAIENSEA